MRTIAAAAAVTAIAVSIRAQQRRQDDLSGEVAVVTGASRGLGLLLATELAGQGCVPPAGERRGRGGHRLRRDQRGRRNAAR